MPPQVVCRAPTFIRGPTRQAFRRDFSGLTPRRLGLYHCPTDHRIADSAGLPAQFAGKPILRSISMNSFLAGTSLGGNPDWVITYPDRKSTRLNSSHRCISYAVFCLKK